METALFLWFHNPSELYVLVIVGSEFWHVSVATHVQVAANC